MRDAQAIGLREQLRDRKDRLERTLSAIPDAEDVIQLLSAVDAAIESLGVGSHGICEICGERLNPDELTANPMARYCLCELSRSELDELDKDLSLAWRIQSALLPEQNLSFAGWQTHYRYLPFGRVSGDYCDLVTRNEPGETLHFLMGDVSGKGVAASLLMAHLNALFRGLIDQALPLSDLVQRANDIFRKNTLSSHYVTLVSGKAGGQGEVEMANAGHCPPLVIADHGITPVDSGSVPMGILDGGAYPVNRLTLRPGEAMFLYTDGLIEARDPLGREYGMEGLMRFMETHRQVDPILLADACLKDVSAFRSGAPWVDDVTIMVVKRASSPQLP